MNHVNFEGLGISLDINQIAFSFYNIKVYWYAIFILLGIVIALLFCKKDDTKYNISFDDILELFIFIIPISIIFARLYFILFNLTYYIENPIKIFNIRDGGLAIYGGIIGAILFIIFFCKKRNIKTLDMLDFISPYLPLGQAIGRWGNFFNLEAHGTETQNIFRMGIIENGNYIQVHPTFLYESICTFIIFIILYLKRNNRNYSGELTYLYFFLYGTIRAIIETFRTDSLMLDNFKISQILSILFSLIFGIILIYKKVKNEKK